jgi:hypothetical protein
VFFDPGSGSGGGDSLGVKDCTNPAGCPPGANDNDIPRETSGGGGSDASGPVPVLDAGVADAGPDDPAPRDGEPSDAGSAGGRDGGL